VGPLLGGVPLGVALGRVVPGVAALRLAAVGSAFRRVVPLRVALGVGPFPGVVPLGVPAGVYPAGRPVALDVAAVPGVPSGVALGAGVALGRVVPLIVPPLRVPAVGLDRVPVRMPAGVYVSPVGLRVPAVRVVRGVLTPRPGVRPMVGPSPSHGSRLDDLGNVELDHVPREHLAGQIPGNVAADTDVVRVLAGLPHLALRYPALRV
jgi:hypothetical protein